MSTNKIKIIFAGTPDFAVPSLRGLINDERFDVVAVISQPDKKVGRKQLVTPPPIKVLAVENKIPVLQPRKIKDLSEKLPIVDLMVVVAYGQIIPKDILLQPKFGCVNVHGSLLPKYRGAACVQAPILNGDKETGITIMKMDAGLDTGPILKQTTISIKNNETTSSLHDKLAKFGAQILPQVLFDFISGGIKPIPQDDSKASYVKQLTKEDGKIDWSRPAIEIERMVRALNPWPGTYTVSLSSSSSSSSLSSLSKRKDDLIKILEVENVILNVNDKKTGEMFVVENKLAIKCGQGTLTINKLQLSGKKPITGKEFIRGYKSSIDNRKS